MSPCCWPAATSNPTHTCSHLTRPACCRASEVFLGKKIHRVKRPTTTSQPTLQFGQEKTPPPFAEVHAYTDFQAVFRAVILRWTRGVEAWGAVESGRCGSMVGVFFAVEKNLDGQGWWDGRNQLLFLMLGFFMVFVLNGTHFLDHQISKKNIALFGLVMLWPLLVVYTQNHSTKMVKKVNKRWWFTTNGTCWWWIQIVMFVIVHPPTPPPQSLTPEIPEKSPEPKFERNVVCLPFPPVFSGAKSFFYGRFPCFWRPTCIYELQDWSFTRKIGGWNKSAIATSSKGCLKWFRFRAVKFTIPIGWKNWHPRLDGADIRYHQHWQNEVP